MNKLIAVITTFVLAIPLLGQASAFEAGGLSTEEIYELGYAEGKLIALCTMYKVNHLDRIWAQRYINASLIGLSNRLNFKSQSSANEAEAALREKVLKKVPRCREVWPPHSASGF